MKSLWKLSLAALKMKTPIFFSDTKYIQYLHKIALRISKIVIYSRAKERLLSVSESEAPSKWPSTQLFASQPSLELSMYQRRAEVSG